MPLFYCTRGEMDNRVSLIRCTCYGKQEVERAVGSAVASPN